MVALRELQLRQILKADVLTTEGTLIVAAGMEVSQVVLDKLRNFAELNGIREPIEVAA
jgi:hypothetical protein